MIKATEFWNFLCDDMNYRMFSGVPCLDFRPLYDKMSPKFMHYVPAVNEKSAFGIVTGAATSGVLAGVIVDSEYLNWGVEWIDFCKKNKNHIVILTNNKVNHKVPNSIFEGEYDKLRKFLLRARKREVPALVILKGEDLK